MLRVIVKQKRKKEEKNNKHHKTNNGRINSKLLIITLNINGLNDLIKRHSLVDGIEEWPPPTCCPMKFPSPQKIAVTLDGKEEEGWNSKKKDLGNKQVYLGKQASNQR